MNVLEALSGWTTTPRARRRQARAHRIGRTGRRGRVVTNRQTMMTIDDEKLALLRTRRNNIRPLPRLLETRLTEFERRYVERRLSEERPRWNGFAASTFPLAFPVAAGRPAEPHGDTNGVVFRMPYAVPGFEVAW